MEFIKDSAGNVGIVTAHNLRQKLDIGNGGFRLGIATVTTINTTNSSKRISTPLSHRNKVINGGMMISQRQMELPPFNYRKLNTSLIDLKMILELLLI